MRRTLLSFLVVFTPLLFSEEASTSSKNHILYLLRSNEISSSIDAYYAYKKSIGKHDFEILEKLCMNLLEEGTRSPDGESQLLSIYGTNLANLSTSLSILESGIASSSYMTQVAAVQTIGSMQDDDCDKLLIRAMASPFLPVRLEAGYYLCVRKHRSACGQLESLMLQMPPPYRVIFPEFFALIGTHDATSVLRYMLEDKDPNLRIESILSSARHHRDDLLPVLRAHVTHANTAEQEACVAALGYFKDSPSVSKLKRLCQSPAKNVQLAALRALYGMGDHSTQQQIFSLAESGDLFAVAMLGEIEGSEDLLIKLVKQENQQIKLNATLSLLQRKDARVLPFLADILFRDTRDLGFYPHFSVGRSFLAWKPMASLEQRQAYIPQDLQAIALAFREHVLRQCIELPEKQFIDLAKTIFSYGQNELIPLLISLLENLQTENVISLLEMQSQKAGAPFIRAYCNLALFRLGKGPQYEALVKEWIIGKKNHEMIRFRPQVDRSLRIPDTRYELTVEESSKLLVDSYQTLADKHQENGIDLILETIRSGHPKNRYVLAGLLLRAIL